MANVSDKFPNVFDYILSEEKAFKTRTVPMSNNWEWNMHEHIDKSFTLKNSQFTKGPNDFSRPFNNIILPIANVNYRTEGFDVKDVEVYVDEAEEYHKSLLTRKFHDKWARKFSIDTAIDESVESYFDFGLTLVKNVNDKRPEVVPLQQLAFADPTNILRGVICIKHQFSISDLQDMKGKWDDGAVDLAIYNARFSHKAAGEQEVQTPGKYVEVYELHGTFPESWLKEGATQEDDGKYSPQLHIVTFYINTETQQKNGLTLFKGREDKPVFKALKRDEVFGRACGRGGIEELFHPQVWTNYSEIHLQQMLEAVSKVVLKSTDKKVAKNNNLKSFKHNQVISLETGTDIQQMVITAPNKTAFDNYMNKWEQIARTIGSASDPQLGLNPVSGTPLGTTEIVTQQGQGIHDYRRGKIATFWGEIYRDWVLNYLVQDMLEGDAWVEELTVEELRDIAEIVATKEANKKLKQMMLKGKLPTKEEQAQFKTLFREMFAKGGKDRFLEIVKGEIKDIPLNVKFNIAGKQAYQLEMLQKLNSVFRTVFANPAVLQNEGVAELFNNILEVAGLSPVRFATLTARPEAPSEPEEPGQGTGKVASPIAPPLMPVPA